jgi:NAD(P)-dependent dehydrogenase (short-subunit alcohol dehydrogenase family)
MHDLIDSALEISVVGSFSSLGIRARRALYGWEDPAPDALVGRTVVITGPTSGLGRQAAVQLAALGARLVLVGRSREKLLALRSDLGESHGEDRFGVVVADMSGLDSVREAAATIADEEPRIDVLIDNAGAMFDERTETMDGIEMTLAVLTVGPFVLLSGLLPTLRSTRGSRVIAVSSGGMYTQPLMLDDLNWRERPYSGPRAYAHGKRAQVMLAREWARRLGGTDPAVVAMHPGWADTPGLASSLPGFRGVMQPILRTPAEGADTLVWLATTPGIAHLAGAFVHDRRRRPFDRVPMTRVDAAQRRRLWQTVVELARTEDPLPAQRA